MLFRMARFQVKIEVHKMKFRKSKKTSSQIVNLLSPKMIKFQSLSSVNNFIFSFIHVISPKRRHKLE